MALALAACLCFASGFLIVSLAWERQSSDLLLRASLAVGFGLGLFSVVFFVGRVFGLSHWITVDFVVTAILLAAYLPRRNRLSPTPSNTEQILPPWFRHTLIAALAIALGCALYAAVRRALAHPHGDGWDAFAIWNLHARFLFLGGPHWRDGFSPLIPWSHPDYPLLLPAAIAHFWGYLGHDDPSVPAVVGFLFEFSTVALLFSALARLRGSTSAMLGSIALLLTPSFLELGAWQYADIPLSFFFLATLALLHLQDDEHSRLGARPGSLGFLVLAGLSAGFAAWTKNEGVLFLCSLVIARPVILLFRRDASNDPSGEPRARQIAPFLLAAAPIFLLIIYFKRFVAPPGDLFSALGTILHRLLDPARYSTILHWMWSTKAFVVFGQWALIPAPLVMLGYAFITRGKRRIDRTFRISVLALALTLAGYFVIYVITPYDLLWHLRFSFVRLCLQLWPSAIFLFFLKVPGRPDATANAS